MLRKSRALNQEVKLFKGLGVIYVGGRSNRGRGIKEGGGREGRGET